MNNLFESLNASSVKWNYISEHGLPQEKGWYIISAKGCPHAIQAWFDPKLRYIEDPYDYSEGFCDSEYIEQEYTGVYAWRKMLPCAPVI